MALYPLAAGRLPVANAELQVLSGDYAPPLADWAVKEPLQAAAALQSTPWRQLRPKNCAILSRLRQDIYTRWGQFSLPACEICQSFKMRLALQ